MILKNKILGGVLLASVFGFSQSSIAAPTISSPYVSKDKTTIELKGEYKTDDDLDDSWGTELSAGYGVTSFWEVEIGAELEDEGDDEDAEFTRLELENKFQLAPKGQYFVDPGFKLTYGHSLNGGQDEVKAELLLAKTVGDFLNKSEIGISRSFGNGEHPQTGYEFSYGFYYDHFEGFELGAEWYSDFGDTTDEFDEQDHKAGPVAIFGLGEGVQMETGALFGVSDAASDVTLKAVLKYKF